MGDCRQQAWDLATLLHWCRLLGRHLTAELGLALYPALFFWDAPGPAYSPTESHWWSMAPDDLIPVQELGPSGCAAEGYSAAAGLSDQTIAMNPRLYCTWLLQQCHQYSAGGRFQTRTLMTSLEHALAGAR